MIQWLKQTLKTKLPPPWYEFYLAQRLYPRDSLQAVRFLWRGWPDYHLPFQQRLALLQRFYAISLSIPCAHTQTQMLKISQAILTGPPGCVVEAGCFKGGSTAKLSLVAQKAGRSMVIFDSFAGIPVNLEQHEKTIRGRHIGTFEAGSYAGSLPEVQHNVQKFGVNKVCQFVPGWFEDTLPAFTQEISVAFIDVDLVSSTRTCLKYLYPLLEPGGALFSHDGHLPLVVELLADDNFWKNEVGYPKPPMEGLGVSTLVKLSKPA